jgi:hypothetical protein
VFTAELSSGSRFDVLYPAEVKGYQTNDDMAFRAQVMFSKVSLVQRFVKSIFSDKHLSTVGEKIDTKPVTIDCQEVGLILWNHAG